MVTAASAYVLNGLTLANVCDWIRVDDEAGAGRIDSGQLIPGRDGLEYDDRAPRTELLIPLSVRVRRTNSSGTVTHGDGGAGHQRENLSLIKRALALPTPVVLARSIPDAGAVRAVVRQIQKPIQSDPSLPLYTFMLTCESGSWQTTAESSDTGDAPTGVATDGDTIIFDPRLSISAAGDTAVTWSDGTTVFTITAASGPTYPVVVDVGAGTVLDDNGADAAGDVTFSDDRWLQLEPGVTYGSTGSSAITTDNAVTVYWRDRWA